MRWVIAAAAIAAALVLVRTLAVGRRLPKTLAERRAQTWGGMPKRYRQTQPGNPWQLRIPRRWPLRKRA
jgi:hypothetical protein